MLTPIYLLLIFALLPVMIIWKKNLLRNIELNKLFRISSSDNQKVNYKPLIIWLLVLTLLVIALARPFRIDSTLQRESQGNAGFIVFDISASMLATDIAPNRLTQAKLKLIDLLKSIKDRAPNERLAIMLFSGSAYTYCPLTQDLSVLINYAKHIDQQLIDFKGSDLNSALNLTFRAIKSLKEENSYIILFTDGEKDKFSLSSKIDESIPIHSLAFGTTAGAPIPTASGGFIKDQNQQIVVSKRQDSALLTLASKSKALFQIARLDNSDIKALSDNLLLNKFKDQNNLGHQKSVVRKIEYGMYFCLTTLLILTICLFIKPKYVIFLLVLLCTRNQSLFAEVENLYQAYKAYQDQDYKGAQEFFQKEVKKNNPSFQDWQRYGSSQYKLNNYIEAEKSYSTAAKKANDPLQLASALHNKGNSQLMQKNFKPAITSYEEALKNNPNDPETKHNLEVAKKLLEKQQQQEQKKEQEQQDQQKKDDQEKKEQQENKKSEEQEDKKEDEKNKQENSNEQNQQKQNSEDENEEEKSENDKQQEQNGKPEEQNETDKNSKELKEKFDNATPEKSAKSSDLKQAEAWLEALPESPLLIKKHTGKNKGTSNQTW